MKTRSSYEIYICGDGKESLVYTAKTKGSALRFIRYVFPIHSKWFSIHHRRTIKDKEIKLRAFDGNSIHDIHRSFKRKGN